MMIPTHIPSEETSPTLCCWFCSTSIVPVPVTQTRTGTLQFCRGGSDRSACEKSEIRVCITTQLNVQFKMPVQFPWNQQAFTGNQEQSSSIQGLLMAPSHPSAPPSSSSLPFFGSGEMKAPSTGGRNLLNCALPIRDAGKYLQYIMYNLIMDTS